MLQLAGDQIMDLKRLLLDAFPDKSNWEELAMQLPGVPNLGHVAADGTVPEIIVQVIAYVRAEEILSSLLSAAARIKPTHPSVVLLLDQFGEGPVAPAGASVDHFQAVLLPGLQVLIDREPLRHTARLLDQNPGSRIFVVDGPSVSGKSFSARFIGHLARTRRTFRAAQVDVNRLPKGQDGRVGPVAVARAIVERMGLDGMPELDQEQEATWVERFCSWLAMRVAAADRPWWIVLDGFKDTLIGQGTNDLILMLADMTLQDDATWRLVLISYQHRLELENALSASIDYEQLDILKFRNECKAKLAEGISALYLERERQQGRAVDVATLTAALTPDITASMHRVLADAPDNHPHWMKALGLALGIEARRVFAANGAVPAGVGAGGGS